MEELKTARQNFEVVDRMAKNGVLLEGAFALGYEQLRRNVSNLEIIVEKLRFPDRVDDSTVDKAYEQYWQDNPDMPRDTHRQAAPRPATQQSQSIADPAAPPTQSGDEVEDSLAQLKIDPASEDAETEEEEIVEEGDSSSRAETDDKSTESSAPAKADVPEEK
ncbi:uncharacterized protein LY89DRAFT_734713 [Mollisia scopiformis]|uniref:Uncharacterized protein n=1 Tax=Mollisia scopiformis TaxID=149040 RepID=A0A194X8X0_MOLSC|nr:uncharacterized protein LY89DRAFT_734713 [Mollisia scopiformis]KUJ16618.1 hypothetical protein LY89DRAFT_734713 [Mollisia scopiformis]